jgi:hypothetical protein
MTAASRLSGWSARMKPILPDARSHMMGLVHALQYGQLLFGSRTKQAVLAGHGGRVDCGDFHRRIAAGLIPNYILLPVLAALLLLSAVMIWRHG